MNTVKRWFRRTAQFLRRRQTDTELEEELQFHLEQRIRENANAGMNSTEARQAALRQFGGVEQIKEECRDVRGLMWLDQCIGDVRVACRSLRRNPGYAMVAIITLALGIGANSAVFSALNSVLFQPLPYFEPDRLVQMVETFHFKERKEDYFAVAPGNYLDWKEQSTVFENMAAYKGYSCTVMLDEGSFQVPAIRASADYFRTLGVEPDLGRWFTTNEDYPTPQPVVVMSHKLWKTRFGSDTNIIGSSIRIDDQLHTVVGVMPPGFKHFSRYWGRADAGLWFPNPFLDDPPPDRNIHRLGTVARLKKGVSFSRAQSEMSMIAKRLQTAYPESNGDVSAGVRLIPAHADLVKDSRKALFMLIGITSFVLLIGCVNVANLFLSRAVTREREMAVRAAIGAGRGSLIRILLTEGLVVGFIAAVVAILFALVGAQIIRALDPGNIPRLAEASLNWQVFLFMFGIAILGGFLAAIVPALQVSKPNLNQALKNGTKGFSSGTPNRRLRDSLVVVEVALTMILLCGAGLMVNTLVRLSKVDPGFERENLLVADLRLPKYRYTAEDGISDANQGSTKIWKLKPELFSLLQKATERLQQLPGVVNSAAVDHLPMSGSGGWHINIKIPGRPEPEKAQDRPWAYERPVTPGYFETLGITLLKGRTITAADTTDSPIPLVINEAGARKYWLDEDPIGQRIEFTKGAVGKTNLAEIVGIVTNVRHEPGGEVEPEVYIHYPQIEKRYIEWQVGFRLGPKIMVRTKSNPEALAEPLRNIMKEIDPVIVLENVQTMNDRIAATFKEQRRFMGFLATFAVLALVLAGVGIYAVISYSVQQRVHELGIRMAIGGSRSTVRNMVLRQGMTPAVIGIGIGAAASLALMRLIASQLFEVKPTDPLTYSIVVGGLLLVCVLACLIPANRILVLDPWTILRDE